MPPIRAAPFRLTRNKTLTSTLFALTFATSVLTVAASNVLPCPARPDRVRFAEADDARVATDWRPVVVQKRPSRWIEEKPPIMNDP